MSSRAAFQDFLNDFGKTDIIDLVEALEAYLGVLLDLHDVEHQLRQLEARYKSTPAARKAALATLRRELKELVDSFARRHQKSLVQLLAVLMDGGISNTPTVISRAIAALAKRVMKLLKQYKDQLDPDTDIEALVKDTVIKAFRALATKLSKRDEFQRDEDARDRERAAKALADELAAAFRYAFDEKYPALLTPNSDEIDALTQDIEALKDEAARLLARVQAELHSLLAPVRELLRDDPPELPAKDIERLLDKHIIAPLMRVPRKIKPASGTPKLAPPVLRKFGIDQKSLGLKIQNLLKEQFRQLLPTLYSSRPPTKKKSATSGGGRSHLCGARRIGHKGRCRRRTTNAGYCNQHAGRVPEKADQAMAGTWLLSGRQTGVPRSNWKATLTLRKNGTATWKETQGANPGARRSGRWNLEDGIFTLSYRAPRTGLVEWRALRVVATTMQMRGNYTTPEVALKDPGFGGTWQGRRAKSG